ncbi:MAG: nuclear transport factor 2 family protein [Acidimicrobiales bacterium]|nr:nuclear transport factor 2 family protein [Acidimicrobiales bacterium]MCB1018028.1 nuclear transport factor 2 family protein [Acidimicrobiales bacterium]MCB9372115.1 nuclear transport factor 2 family protein [Microthrixaceae bacterium]
MAPHLTPDRRAAPVRETEAKVTPSPAARPSPNVDDVTPVTGRDDPTLSIERLLFTYAERVDAGDFAGVGALFADGAVALEDGTELARGAEAVEALYVATTRRYEDDGTPHTKHVTTNVMVDVDDDGSTATARSSFTVLQALPDFPLQAIISGRYLDRFERDGDGAWRFVERRMIPELHGDLSRHLLIDL